MLRIRNLVLLCACFYLSDAALSTPAPKPTPQAVNNQVPASGANRLKPIEPVKPLIPLSDRNIRPISKPFVVTGEVVDAWCYASQTMGSGRGDAHKPCALACIGGGVTPGIVDDKGTLYIAAKYKAYTGCRELLMPYAAKRVKVTGWLTTKGGCNVLKIQKVEPAK